MDKTAYSRLIIVWHRHKPWHVRSKVLLVLMAIGISVALGYISLYLLHSRVLFFVLMVILGMRLFYLLAKGDWFDLASQLGLKCWHCDYVFNNDAIVEAVMEKNACPKCHHPVYDEPAEKTP